MNSPVSFSAALARLETLVVQLEQGQLPLEEALAKYEQGVALLTLCEQQLHAAEQQIQRFDADVNEPIAD